jgi:maleate isomerase
MTAPTRVGLVVPSSNTTIETEVPEMLRRTGAPYTFHSSRAVLHSVDAESLDRMVGQADRNASELADARVDAIVYACLVAVMARGANAHEGVERRLEEVARENGAEPAITSSAGALVRMLQAHGLQRVAILTPYVDALTKLVVAYIEAAGVKVVDSVSLRVPDNVEVGRLDPMRLPELASGMDLGDADAVILSACVQMPSLPAITIAEEQLGLPVLSAATATVHDLLVRLGRAPEVPGAGRLLGAHAVH